MRRHAVFRHAVHFVGTDLHFKRNGFAADHRGVQALIAVGLGRGDVILKAVRQRMIHIVDLAQCVIAFRHIVQNNAHRINIVNFVKVFALHIHFAVYAVHAFYAALDAFRLDAVFFQVLADIAADAI